MKSTRKNIAQPADWWEAFVAAATGDGQTLSEWMGEAAKRRLGKRAKGLSKRTPRGKQPKETKKCQ
jgi:hypothetical protein